MEYRLVNSIADLYKLTPFQLVDLDRMGEKLAQKLIQAIQESKKTTFC